MGKVQCYFLLFNTLIIVQQFFNQVHGSYGSSSDSSSSSSDDELDFTIPRQCPRLEFADDFLSSQREFWHQCMVGFLLDVKFILVPRLQDIIDNAWHLQGSVRVIGKFSNIYMMHFERLEDRWFMQYQGPWALQNKLFVMDD